MRRSELPPYDPLNCPRVVAVRQNPPENNTPEKARKSLGAAIFRLSAGGALVAGLLFAMSNTLAFAQNYPERDIELVVAYSAGGSVDSMARAFAEAMGRELGSKVVVHNRDGAGGTIGTAHVAGSRPDGHVLLFGPSTPLTQVPFLVGKVPYELNQFQPICQVFQNPFVIAVRLDSPYQSAAQLLDAAKAAPGTVSYGHAGVGSVPQLAVATLARAKDVRFNDIAFRGDAGAIPQVLGGHVDFGALGASTVAGRDFRVLAVLGDKRLPVFPDAPAMTELGAERAIIARNGIYAPADTPQPVVERLQSACEAVAKMPEFQEAASRQHQQITFMDAASFQRQLQDDYRANGELIQALGLAAKE